MKKQTVDYLSHTFVFIFCCFSPRIYPDNNYWTKTNKQNKKKRKSGTKKVNEHLQLAIEIFERRNGVS